MQSALFRQAFDRGYLATFRIETEHQAGKNRTPIDQHHASAAFAKFATMLRSGEIQIFAQDFKQGLVRREGDFGRFTVQNEPNVRLLFGHLWFLRKLCAFAREISPKRLKRPRTPSLRPARRRRPASWFYPTPHYRSAASCQRRQPAKATPGDLQSYPGFREFRRRSRLRNRYAPVILSRLSNALARSNARRYTRRLHIQPVLAIARGSKLQRPGAVRHSNTRCAKTSPVLIPHARRVSQLFRY